MNKLDLQKKAVDIRKGIVSSVHSAKQDIRADHFQQQTFLLIFILRNYMWIRRIQRMRTEIVLYYPKDIQHRVTIQPLLREDFPG